MYTIYGIVPIFYFTLVDLNAYSKNLNNYNFFQMKVENIKGLSGK